MRRRSFFLYVLPAILLLFPACHKETEENRVRETIAGVQQAVEEKKIPSVLEHVSKAYRDPQGNDYDGIKGLLAFYFFRHQKVRVFIPSIDVTVTGTTAKALFQAVLTGNETGEAARSAVLPDTLGAYDFEVQFKKEEDRWEVTSARWGRTGEGTGAGRQ